MEFRFVSRVVVISDDVINKYAAVRIEDNGDIYVLENGKYEWTTLPPEEPEPPKKGKKKMGDNGANTH